MEKKQQKKLIESAILSYNDELAAIERELQELITNELRDKKDA